MGLPVPPPPVRFDAKCFLVALIAVASCIYVDGPASQSRYFDPETAGPSNQEWKGDSLAYVLRDSSYRESPSVSHSLAPRTPKSRSAR